MNKEVENIIEKAIDYAFESNKFVLNFYDYLKSIDAKGYDATAFIESKTASNINSIVMDLDDYLEGGADEMHKQLREAYGHIPKPQARKIRNYLYGILEDAWKYEKDKARGRKKTKNK